MLKSYRTTLAACYLGYTVQAIVNNYLPLLFLMFTKQFGFSLKQITLFVTVNFAVQLLTDVCSSKIVDLIGMRISAVTAHLLAAAGLGGLALFPFVFPSAFGGILFCIVLYSVGGGLIEVVVSPVAEACPTKNKAASMSLLHSFYCWGSAFVILTTTLFFFLAGENWRILALAFTALPLFNAVFFALVPLYSLTESGKSMPLKTLFRKGTFWIFAALMLTAGAAELAVSQWASAFAEAGLQLSKQAGDLAGPCLFAVLMGLSRVLFALFGKRFSLANVLICSAVLCVGAYLITALSPLPVLSLVGCALCGFSVGILWPGVFSLASKEIPEGGTSLFALLAFGGDAGCTLGPSLVGLAAGSYGLSRGLLIGVAFPALMVLLLVLLKLLKRKKSV